jgi:VanZ family protein
MKDNRFAARDRRWGVRLWIVVNGLYAVSLMVLALVPQPTGVGLPVSDIAVHGTLFGCQALLMYAVLARLWAPRKAVFGAWLGAATYGLVIELLQLLQPARVVELKDVLANCFGAAAACIGIVLVRRVRATLRGTTRG